MSRIPVRSVRNLVFARVGGQSLHRAWLAEVATDRNWHLQLSSYDAELTGLTDGDFPLSIDTGTKWDSIGRYFTDNNDLLDRYDYVMFPDDDLLFGSGMISKIFDISAMANLDIAQPALLPESYFSYPIVLQCPRFRLRYTNYVEPMCPVIRTSYLKMLLPLLASWRTGWGQDDIWTLLMPEPAYRAAVIDAAPILHTRPLYTGDIYRAFAKRGWDPHADLAEIRRKYSGLPNAKLVYGGILRSGNATRHIGANLLNGLHLLRVAWRLKSSQRETVRGGLGMLIRMATRLGYRPVQVKLKDVTQPSPVA